MWGCIVFFIELFSDNWCILCWYIILCCNFICISTGKAVKVQSLIMLMSCVVFNARHAFPLSPPMLNIVLPLPILHYFSLFVWWLYGKLINHVSGGQQFSWHALDTWCQSIPSKVIDSVLFLPVKCLQFASWYLYLMFHSAICIF